MVGIDKVTPASPYWKINPKGDKQQEKKDRERERQERNSSRDKEHELEDGRPHIDEFA